MLVTPGPSRGEPSKQASALGAEIRQLRAAAGLSQTQLASRVGRISTRPDGTPTSTGKSTVSRLEQGNQTADDDLLKKIAEELGGDFETLRELRDADATRSQSGQAPGARRSNLEESQAAPPSDRLPPSDATHAANHGGNPRRFAFVSTTRVLVAATLSVFGVAALLLWALWPTKAAAHSTVRITSPGQGATIPEQISVRGTVVGYKDDDLWLDVRGNDGDTHHPTEIPCRRHGDHFELSPFYVGQKPPLDDQRSFSISVLVVQRDSAAERFFYRYANRPKNSHEYDGLRTLPPGARIADTVAVVRGRT